MALIKIEPYIIDTTGDFTFNTVNATGNLSSLNANLGNLAIANFFSGSGNNLSNIQAANISGQVANALLSGTVYTNAQPNITSVGTLTGLTSTGTVNLTGASNVALGPVANVHITGGSNGQYLQTDGSGTLTWSTVSSGSTSNISNGNSNVNIPSSNGNINFSAVGNTVMVISGTGVNVAGTLNTGSGIITGNGNGLSSIVGANVTGQVGNSLIAGTVYTNAQPNITSVGNLSGLTVNGGVYGEVVATQFASVWGSGAGPNPYSIMQVRASDNVSGIGMQAYTGSGTLYGNTAINFGLAEIKDKDIPGNLVIKANIDSTGLNVTGIVSASGNVTGGNLVSNGTLSVTGDANLGNAATANFFIGSGNNLSNISAGNVTGQIANALISGTVYTNAQPNITSVGSLTGLTISNATGVVDFTTTANVTLGAVANLHISGGTGGYVLSTDGSGTLSWVAQSGGGGGASISNGNSNVNIPAANGNINFTAVGNTTMVITGTGANIGGTLNVTGQSNLGAVGNVVITGGTNGYVLSTNGSGGLSWIASGGGGGGGASISNGTSNVDIATSGGNITMGVAGTANVVVVSTAGISAAIQPRVVTIADGTTVTMNADTTDMAIQTNTQTAGTLTIAAPTGTPYQGQKLMFRLQSTNVQTFSWNAIFDGSTDLNLPTASSGSSKYDYMGFIYNSTSSKWDMLSKNFGF